MDKKIQISEIGWYGDTVEAQVCGEGVCVECDNPWSGDTESGFGRSAAVTLNKAQAHQLAQFLLAFAEAK